MYGPSWVAVVPIKPLALAKSRLRGAVPDRLHDRLVLAMAQDTVVAALSSGRVGQVLVVTDDADARAVLDAAGARCVPDEPRAGLNAAFAHGARLAAGYRPGRLGVAALAADLPALRPAELAAALDAAALQAATLEAAALDAAELDAAALDGTAGTPSDRSAGQRAFVPDAGGRGTVLLTAPAGTDLDPRFGPGSAAAHGASGAFALDGDWPGLRRDVDTAADLSAAADLGLGRCTAKIVRAARYRVDGGGRPGG